MYRIEICDDDSSIAQLKHILERKKNWSLSIQALSEKQLLEEIEQDSVRADILFLTVCLLEKDGVELAFQLKQKHPELFVIFLAELKGDLPDICRADPDGLLTKPFCEEQVMKIMNRIMGAPRPAKYLQLGNRGSELYMKFDEICYIESSKRYAYIHQRDDVHKVRMKLVDLEEKMPDYFVRCHQSYLVNTHMVIQMTDDQLMIANHKNIPVSRSHRQQTRKKMEGLCDEKNL